MARHLLQYDIFGDSAAARSDTSESHGAELEASAPVREPPAPVDDFLYPPGPLATLRLSPGKLRLAPDTERTLRAQARDADGRPARGSIEYSWSLEGPGTLHGSGSEALYRAPDVEGDARVLVEALQGDVLVAASAALQIREGASANPRVSGIPEPQPVYLPSESWRSRMHAERWEYNEAHRDYQAIADDETRRLRYLIHLFAKEVVLKNFGRPVDEELLERMVEVLTHIGDGRGR